MEKSWNSLEDKLQEGNVHKVGQMLYRLTTLALVAGLSVVFVVWCVLPNEMCTMAWITTKEYIYCDYGKANEKEWRLYFRERTWRYSLCLHYRQRKKASVS